MGEWPQARLVDLVECLDHRRLPIRSQDRVAGPFPYYGASGVIDHVRDFIFEGLHLLIAEDGENLRTRKTPIAFLASGKFWVNNHAHVVRGNERADTRYLAYAVQAADISGYLTGSTQPKLTKDSMLKIRIPSPSPAEQRAIAGVLGALDDKIESNRRIASTCESLARVLLEVELAGSSEAVPVGSAARFRNRERKPLSASQRAEMLGKRVYPYFGATGVFDYVDDYLFDDLTVLVGEDGSVVNDDGSPVVQLAWGKYWVNNHAHVLVGEGIATELLYIALKRSDVRPLVTGAVQAKISMGNLRTLQLELPPPDERTALGVELQLILGRLRRALDETAVLEVTRDALLPELLSGRLRVREVEEMVGSV